MASTIQHQLFYAHPANKVWEYLTNPDLISLWLMENDFQPAVGHEFQFKTNPIPAFQFDGIIFCKVLEVVPFKKLVYTWKGGPGDGTITMDSVVTWTLQENQSGTTLSLEHSGFEHIGNLPLYTAMDQGWLKNMHKITSLLQSTGNG